VYRARAEGSPRRSGVEPAKTNRVGLIVEIPDKTRRDNIRHVELVEEIDYLTWVAGVD
jgi:hypothetical protein